jgi:hypothetical protein
MSLEDGPGWQTLMVDRFNCPPEAVQDIARHVETLQSPGKPAQEEMESTGS